MERIKTAVGILVLVGAFTLPACVNTASPPTTVTWRLVDPPRAGLRCWYAPYLGHGAVYCEPETP